MLQTVATMVSLILAGCGMLVIGASLADNWGEMVRALGFVSPVRFAALPPRTHKVAAPRKARIVRVSPSRLPQRAVA